MTCRRQLFLLHFTGFVVPVGGDEVMGEYGWELVLDVTTPPAVEEVSPRLVEVAEEDLDVVVVDPYASEVRVLESEVKIPIALEVVSPELKVEGSDEKSDDVLLPISETSEDVESPLVVGGVYSGGDDVVLVKPPSAVEVSKVDEAESVAVDNPELTMELVVDVGLDDPPELEV